MSEHHLHDDRNFGSKAEILGVSCVALLTVAVAGGIWLVMRPLEEPQNTVRLSTTQPVDFAAEVFRTEVGPGPLDRLQKWENEQLHQYGWIDRERNIVRVPIERAMEIIAERGLPSRALPLNAPAASASIESVRCYESKDQKPDSSQVEEGNDAHE